MKNKLLFFVTMCALSASFVFAAHAGPLDGGIARLNTAVNNTGLQSDITVSIGTVVRGVLAGAGTIFLVLTVYAGIIWMTAQGAAEKIEKAQSIVTAAVVGLVITMSAYAITIFVTGRVNTGGPQTNYAAQCASHPNGVCKLDVRDCNVQGGAKTEMLGGSCPVCCY